MVHYIYKGEKDEQVPENTTRLSFRPGVTIIHHNAFEDFGALLSIDEFPSTLTSIGDYAFHDCSSLTSLPPFPSTLTSIGDCAFDGCSSLTYLPPFPSTLTFIGYGAFFDCSSLKNIIQINADIVIINKRDGSWKAECQKRLAFENQIIAKLCISRIHSSEAARIRIINTALLE